jgi:hypothetical protein
MYGGLDKGGGGVVGSADSQLITVEFGEVSETTSAEEILICEEISESGEPRKVFAHRQSRGEASRELLSHPQSSLVSEVARRSCSSALLPFTRTSIPMVIFV